MTNTIADIESADVILITGSNTTENHPVISSAVKRAVKFKGARLIVVDPRRIKIAGFAHQWLRPNLGTDVAWINGLDARDHRRKSARQASSWSAARPDSRN